MTRKIANILLSSFIALALISCSARVSTSAIPGSIQNYQPSHEAQRSFKLSWKCRSTNILDQLFSPTGDRGCDQDLSRYDMIVPIESDGAFEVPALDIKVRKYLSSPSLYFRWEQLVGNRDAEHSAKLLTSGKVDDGAAFVQAMSQFRRLNHTVFEDVCIPAIILATDGTRRVPFHELRQIYPESYNLIVRYILGVTLRHDGINVMTQEFELPYSGNAFCGENLEFFTPLGHSDGVDELDYRALIEIGATVVYSRSAPDSRTGQRQQVSRYVSQSLTRSASTPYEQDNQIPEDLAIPVNVAVDIRPEGERP